MQNIASICSVTQGLLWSLVLTQVKAEKIRDSLIKNKTKCTQTYKQVAGNINVCWAAFVPQGSTIPQMPRSSPPSLAIIQHSSQLGFQPGNSCSVYLESSFLARIEYRSDDPDSSRSMKQFLRDQDFIALVKRLEITSGGSAHPVLPGSCWECCCFSWLFCPPRAISTAGRKEMWKLMTAALLLHHPLSPIQLHWTHMTGLSCNENVLVTVFSSCQHL